MVEDLFEEKQGEIFSWYELSKDKLKEYLTKKLYSDNVTLSDFIPYEGKA